MNKVLVVATSRKTRGGITSVVKAHEQGPQWEKYHCHWVETHRDGSKYRKILYFIKGLADFLFRLPCYDLVHIHFSNGNSLKRKLIFARLAKLLKKKILIHFHAFDPDTTLNGTLKTKYRELFEMADGIIVLSEWWKKEVQKQIANCSYKIQVLYNPCEHVVKDSNITPGNYILYAGTVNSRKGYDVLIRAFSHIVVDHSDWKLVIAGNGEIEEGKKIAHDLGIIDKVSFLGWVQGDEKRKAFQEASIFCLPSYAEGFPMAVLDAWAYGLPVITTPVGGIPDIAKDGENMLLFNPGDIDELSRQLVRVIEDKVLRDKISGYSNSFANGEFSINTVNSELSEVYSKILKEK